ncbi:MAG: 16S rRNA (cytidine(1402)-2'-O)-methyltransferase, partial [Thermomicrobiaceae bacterium]|nr:16S rRNA (cytidine(1402)-2'-O)-methyltransferase [Thermomicrobiaceae bacterium]
VPLVLYEAPHRLAETLADLEATLGDRPLAICRELTKVHEEIDRTTVRRAREAYAEREPRGEFVLVVGVGERAEPAPEAVDVEALLRARLAAGESPSAAAREVARAAGLPRSEVYRRALALREAAGDGQA